MMTVAAGLRSSTPHTVVDSLSPLAAFSDRWNNLEYQACNTASRVAYMTPDEKNTIYILNLARQYPQLFLETVVLQYPTYSGEERLRKSDFYKSLVTFLRQRKPLPILSPDSALFQSAFCHAQSSGRSGYVGHNRQTRSCKSVEKFRGECCDYGSPDPLTIVMHLLIDEGVESLGHRLILFNPYSKIGVSIQPHKNYRWNAVLDLE